MASAKEHRTIRDQFLQQAEQEYATGDLLQSSEKAWGAVAHCILAIARQREWPVGSHRRLIENAMTLIRTEPEHEEYRKRLLLTMEGLHANFYQSHLDEDLVRSGLDNAKELIEVLMQLDASMSP